MRRQSLKFLALGSVLGAALLAVPHASAQTFPNPPTNATPFWIPMMRTAAVITDPVNAANTDMRDIVGDSLHPAAYIASDATYLYLRLRVNGSPGAINSIPPSRGFGCLIDTNGTLTNYELLAILDGTGATDMVRLLSNTVAGTADTSTNPAETQLGAYAATTNAQVSVADTTFSGDADAFVDLAVPWTAIRTGPPVLTAATSLRFICGTSVDAAVNTLGNDIFDGAASTALTANWSDAYVCNNGGNGGVRCTTAADSDGDGVPNGIETSFGTNPNNFDSDADGIPDYYEVTNGPDVTFNKYDTDNDGKIDALDTDSDNDCAPDSTDGLANYRNVSLPNANANANCSGTKPICDKVSGAVCSACNGDFGSGNPLSCSTVAKPYCNASGACAECTPSATSACGTLAKPACESTTGTCSACNGDRLSGASASCPGGSTPACNLSGALAGTCTQCSATNASLCPPQSPACASDTGSCAQCNGDHGAATTAACPTTTQPGCNTAGPFKGRCTICTVTNTSLCPVNKPACDSNGGVCTACDGDRNGGSQLACPIDTSPTCVLKGATKGQCGKCTTSADCGSGHTGPTCDPASGACIDVDSDGDGVQDETENLLGTDPMKADTDGDGISDKLELTPNGGGQFMKVDTNGDNVIDALDLDSDSDGIPDHDEAFAAAADMDAGADADVDASADAGAPTALLDTDGDKIPNYRDTDDDGDAITTKQEIDDANAAKVSDDVDGDGLKNWLDSDANGNGVLDGVDSRADDDQDGIPNYLDLKKDAIVPEAGPPDEAGSSTSSTSSSGFTPPPKSSSSGGDAGDGGTNGAADDGVLEGSGCSTTGGPLSAFMAFGLGVLGLGLVTRRRRRR